MNRETYLRHLHAATSDFLATGPQDDEEGRLQSLAGMFLTLLQDGKDMQLTQLFRLNFPEYYADEPNLFTILSYGNQPN